MGRPAGGEAAGAGSLTWPIHARRRPGPPPRRARPARLGPGCGPGRAGGSASSPERGSTTRTWPTTGPTIRSARR
ncbi:hypothetical protein HMPREF0569_1245 [Micrococcus luteus SK58]|nr:hypothetical protein HMPREF0569_1245 [Micrococcus luteus SK58]